MIFNVYLGLGTNLGDKAQNLKTAIELIENEIGGCIKQSAVYYSTAWGIKEQPDFLNQVILIQTKFPPLRLIQKILDIENQMGRTRRIKWGERLIDIDILIMDAIVLHTSNLTIPHPYISERIFVIKPLAEIAPDFQHPIYRKNFETLLSTCSDTTSLLIY